MAKNWNLQDIKPPERKRRRRVPTQAGGPGGAPPTDGPRPPAPEEEPMEDPYIDRVEVVDGRGKRAKKAVISVVIVAILFVAGFGVTTMLRGAEVRVFPKFEDVNIDATFTSATSPQVGELGHENLTLTEEGERTVTANGQEEVSEQAKGVITIYNEYSENPQRLIKNTRFESPDGLIFRIQESVEVPGYRTVDGSVIPGEIKAEVFADGPGEQYNIGPSRFTIPGLEGSEQFETMYADSSEDFSGGYEGMRFVLDESEVLKARQELQLELRDRLLARLPNERPAGFELFDGAVTFEFDQLPSAARGSDNAVIKEQARLIVPLFSDAEFAEYIAENTIAVYEGLPVRIDDTSKITFNYPSATQDDISDDPEIEFKLKGKVRLIWTFDKEKLRNDLAGLAKTALPSVLSAYPAIERAEAVVRPFWKQSFPDEPDGIEITEVFTEDGQ